MTRLLEKQQLIILALVAVAVIGFASLRYYPLTRQAKNIRQTAALQSDMIAVTEEQTRKLPQLRTNVDQLRQVAETYDTKIPLSRDFAGLWQQIAEVMNKHNLKDQIVQPETEIHGQTLNCIPISVKCSGSLDQIFGLCQSLDGFERLIRVKQIKLLNDKDFTGRLELDVKASVYYRNQTQAKGD
ncbi:MAG: type 4a pilus biogenesis protein PilO [Planctomycetes bacterium]|nr:type 4a pilus biogenesis protein PilO [Planctomycetota bacterium]